MKGNKEFIDGVYKKYEEYQDEKKFKTVTEIKKSSKKNIKKILSIAAMIAIVIVGVNVENNFKKDEIKSKVAKTTTTSDKITLKTVDSFENLYNIAKENSKNIQNTNSPNDFIDSADTIKSDSTTSLPSPSNFSEQASSSNKENSKPTQSSDNYSKTNIQVENVDEADIVKTDGKYIYYIADENIEIIDINKKEELNKISEISYKDEEFTPLELYINKDKLIVIGNEEKSSYKINDIFNRIYKKRIDKQKTVAILYDLTNIKEPEEVRRVEIDGNYVSSRMIDNNIYFVANKNIYSNNLIKDDIKDLNEKDFMPSYTDTAKGLSERYIDFNNIYYFENMESLNYLSLAGFDINSTKEVNIQTFLGAGEDIYASTKNMYIAKSKTVYDADTKKYLGMDTKILKFNLNNGKITFKAEANIEGGINNQFSMDENDKGEFRIATTIGEVSYEIDESKSTNSLFILDENLKELGRLDNIAPGEQIYSVRYAKDKAYVVTFYEMDPLFVIDLSDSKKPKILGELKIPGYSSYLHPYDETHLIGFGYDTEANGSGTGVVRNGLKMSMFDISDFKNPKEMFNIKIGDKNISSELTSNHKALLFSKEKNFIAFPITSWKDGKSQCKAQIYNIDLEKGFNLKGEIKHNGTDYKKCIQRIIYSNDVFYTLSQKLIKATDMDTLKEIVKLDL